MLQNRMEIFKGAKDEMIQEGFIHKLVIKKLIAKDAGNYTLSCDGVTTSCNVAVKGKSTMYVCSCFLCLVLQAFNQSHVQPQLSMEIKMFFMGYLSYFLCICVF